jgi:hypothetical protein
MSNYIGNQPSAGEFKRLDSIASLFNGSTTQFNLNYNTVSQPVGDSSQLIVSLNGIVQEPLESYTLGIGGSSIVFSIAPTAGDTCHIVLLGGVGNTVTPADGSVTASKLDASLKDYLEETFVADGIQTDFTLTRAVVGINNLLVTIDGIVQPSSAFTATGTTLTISEVLAANTDVRVVHMGVKAGVYVPANDSITADMLANSINDDIAAGVAALPLAGGTMTGVIGNFESTGIDDQAASTSVTILSDGKVGIGTSSPDTLLDVSRPGNGQIAVLQTTANRGFSFESQSDTALQIASIQGLTNLDLWANTLTFSAGATERARIDSDGGFMVGTTTHRTAEFSHPDGFSIRNDVKGQFQSTVTDGLCGLLNRDGSSGNGDILGFRHEGVDIGRIGYGAGSYFKVNASTDYMTIGTPAIGLRFANDFNSIHGYHPSNDANRNDIDLGYNGIPFGNLYLSGGIQFDARSNKLDDYEEGTWTPLFGDNSTTASNGGQFSATYVKIGKLVTVSADITTLTYSGANLNYMYGLPFAGGVSGVGNGGGGIGYTTTTGIVPGLHVTSNTSAIYFINLGTNVGGEILSISGKRFIFSLTYETS